MGSGRGWRDGCGEPWPFWKGWEGLLGSVCLREERGGVEEQRDTWWPQNGGRNTHVGGRGRERERERSDMRNAGLFRGRRTTQLREITMESEEKGRGPPYHHGTSRQK